MNKENNQKQKKTNQLVWCVVVGVSLLCLLSYLSPAYASYKSASNVVEEARVAQLKIDITSDALSGSENQLNLADSDTSQTFTFTLKNYGETVVHVKKVVLNNVDLPIYHFSPDQDFYILPDEEKELKLQIYGSDPSYCIDIEKRLELQIIAEQVD